MKKSALLSMLVRSLSIQASFNFCTLQGLGFLYALLPSLDQSGKRQVKGTEGLRRHLERFNTHPFMAPAVIASVARLEEAGDPGAGESLKGVLMGPYAAIGDVFFWGALRVLASVLAVLLVLMGFWIAPLALLLLHNPAQFWVRFKGFFAGYGLGKMGVAFIGALALPEAAGRIRWLSLTLLGFVAVLSAEGLVLPWAAWSGVPQLGLALALVLCFWFAIRRGLSQVKVLYGAALLCMVIAI